MTFSPKVWDDVLRRLCAELPSFAFEAWIRPLVPVVEQAGAQGGAESVLRITLLCPTGFHRDRVRDRFLEQIAAAVENETRCEVVAVAKLCDAAKKAEPALAEGRPAAMRVARTAEVEARAAVGTSSTPGAATLRPQPVEASRTESRRPQPVEASRTESRRLQPVEPSRTEPPRRRQPVEPRRAEQVPVGTPAANARPPGMPMRRPVQQGFDNFVVGPSNALAREASLSLARSSSSEFNQLYLSGASGLGKTHLARAMAGESARLGSSRIRYCTAESFTNEFMTAVRAKEMGRFKRRYRKECEILIVEDVGFLDSKALTQLEFFHSVQHVLDAGGRVVLTGDRLPHELQGLDEKLRKQVAGGFVAEVVAPDADLRRAILRAKAAAGGVRLPEACAELIVEQAEGSVRDLEGVLIQLVTTASLLGRPIDLNLTREAVSKKGGHAKQAQPKPDPTVVIRVVSSYFKTTPEALASRSRRRGVLLPRQLAMYLCRRYTDASLGEIGRAFDRDHPSVKNAVARVERQILERAPIRYQVEALCQALDGVGREAAQPPRP